MAPLAVGAGLAALVAGGFWLWLTAAALLVLGLLCALQIGRGARLERSLAHSRQDFEDLIDLPMHTSFLCAPDGTMTELGERWTDWTGQSVDEACAGRWVDTIHPDDRERVGEAFVNAMTSRREYFSEHRMLFRDGSYRWIRCRAFPNFDRAGALRSWTGLIEDNHEQCLAEEQFRQTASLLESIGNSTDSIMWAKDRDGRMLYINRALERLAGVTLADVLGKTDHEWNANHAEAEAFQAADRRVLASGQAEDIEEVFTGSGGTTRTYRSIKSPLRDRSGNIIGVMGVATDITEARESEQRERLLLRELDHRAKNLLAVVQSVVTLTRASTIDEFKAAVEGRIHALGRAHSMLASARWEGADLARILSEELAPYDDGGPLRIGLEGPPLLLRPAMAQSLALVIHELATNAVKYGALSTAEGRLAVSWEVGETASGASGLRLRWTETRGPAPATSGPPAHKGFGTRLIHSSIERQLGGTLELDFAPEGLTASLEVPLERVAARAEVQPSAASAAEQPRAA